MRYDDKVFDALASRDKLSALSLAVLMHGVLAFSLVIAVRWQTQHVPRIIEAEIWTASVAPPAPELAVPAPPPAPVPVSEAPATPRADITLRAKAEKNKSAERVKPPSFDALLASEEAQLDRRKTEADRQRKAEDEARKIAQAHAESRELERRRQALAREQATADYRSRLQGKIRGNLVQPPNLAGNPVAQFAVTQLPTGDVIDVKLKRTSGNASYDAAVERAIRKSSPLPRPENAAVFSRDLVLTFCPDEERGCR